MSLPILATKLYIPPSSPNVLPRIHLIERLNEGLRRKLTLISAPPGFGKTTLISEWRMRIPDTDDPQTICRNPKFGWLSLDEGDNDPAQFLRYLLAALQKIIPDFGEAAEDALRMPQPPSMELVLTSIVNEIALMAEAGELRNCCYTLVIDDYHIIQSQAVHDIMQFFLEHLPLPLHLAICSRADIPWSLSRLRANDQITELRSTDLRFTLEETAEFLNRLMRLDLSAPDLSALEEQQCRNAANAEPLGCTLVFIDVEFADLDLAFGGRGQGLLRLDRGDDGDLLALQTAEIRLQRARLLGAAGCVVFRVEVHHDPRAGELGQAAQLHVGIR